MVVYEVTGTLDITTNLGNLSKTVTGSLSRSETEVTGIIQIVGTPVQYIPIRATWTPPNTFVALHKTFILRKEVFTMFVDDAALVADVHGLIGANIGIVIAGTTAIGDTVDMAFTLTVQVDEAEDGAVTGGQDTIDVTPTTPQKPIGKRINVKQDPFLNLANMVGVEVLKSDSNQDIKKKILQAATDQRNTTYEGLINAISQDLKIEKKAVLRFGPKTDGSEPVESDKVIIEMDGGFLRIYQLKIDKEHFVFDLETSLRDNTHSDIAALADYVNRTSRVVDATVIIDPQTPPRTLMIQSNVKSRYKELIQSSTHLNTDFGNIVRGSLRFSNTRVFNREVGDEQYLLDHGDYFVDYTTGQIRCIDLPRIGDFITYKYIEWPFEAKAADVAINEFNSRPMRRHLFDQIDIQQPTTKDPEYQTVDGPPTAQAIDMIKELLHISNIHWGE